MAQRPRRTETEKIAKTMLSPARGAEGLMACTAWQLHHGLARRESAVEVGRTSPFARRRPVLSFAVHDRATMALRNKMPTLPGLSGSLRAAHAASQRAS